MGVVLMLMLVVVLVSLGCVKETCGLQIAQCDATNALQRWDYSNYLLEEFSIFYHTDNDYCLDCGDCTEGVVPTDQVCDHTSPLHQQRWTLVGSVLESSNDYQYCLSSVGDAVGASLIMLQCGFGDELQQWHHNTTYGWIVHKSTGLCLDATPSTASCSVEPFSSYPYCDPTAEPTVRAQDLVSRLTLEETCLNLWSRAGGAPGVPRLGVPFLKYSEALHGVVTDCGAVYNGNTGCPTSFPHALALGATFNRSLWAQIGGAISTEARALYNQGIAGLLLWAPDINLFRDPRWGRGQEVPGEDPYLTSEYATFWVTAMQNTTTPNATGGVYLKTVPTAKHFADYDLDNWEHYQRSSYDATISDQDQNEYYMVPFKAAIQRSNIQSIMCAYPAVNGVPCCANEEFMNEMARGEWGFQGFFVSDCDAVSEIMTKHHYTWTWDETAKAAMLSGCDAACDKFYGEHLPNAVRNGAVPQEALEQAFVRVWTEVFTLGELDDPSLIPWSGYGPEKVDSQEHRNLALSAAQQAIVLLKNDGILPLSKATKVAILGPHFNVTQDMLSIYRGTNTLVDSHSPLQAITNMGITVVGAAAGCELSGTDTSGFAEALQYANMAEVAIVFVGLHPGQGGGDAREDEGFDRTAISLPGMQLNLVQEIVNTGTPTVVVLVHGGQLAIEWVQEFVPAVVDAFYPGELGGDAIASVLFGEVSPAGRLPYTVYDSGFVSRRKMTDQSLRDNGGITYLYYQDVPLFPFGWGLSYTTFNYTILSPQALELSGEKLSAQLSSMKIKPEDDQSYIVQVTNVGHVVSDVVVLGFITGDGDSTPFQKLFGFERVSALAPGQSAVVSLPVTADSFATASGGGPLRVACEEGKVVERGVLIGDPLVNVHTTLHVKC